MKSVCKRSRLSVQVGMNRIGRDAFWLRQMVLGQTADDKPR